VTLHDRHRAHAFLHRRRLLLRARRHREPQADRRRAPGAHGQRHAGRSVAAAAPQVRVTLSFGDVQPIGLDGVYKGLAVTVGCITELGKACTITSLSGTASLSRAAVTGSGRAIMVVNDVTYTTTNVTFDTAGTTATVTFPPARRTVRRWSTTGRRFDDGHRLRRRHRRMGRQARRHARARGSLSPMPSTVTFHFAWVDDSRDHVRRRHARARGRADLLARDRADRGRVRHRRDRDREPGRGPAQPGAQAVRLDRGHRRRGHHRVVLRARHRVPARSRRPAGDARVHRPVPGLGGRARRAVRHAQGRAVLGRGVHPGQRAHQPRPGARGALLALPLRPPHRRDRALRHHHRRRDHGGERPSRRTASRSTSPRRRRRRSPSPRPCSGSSTSSARARACTSRSRSSSAAP
jgi:hypothetical protein